MPDSSAQLYEEDFVRWTEQQAAALREAAAAGTNLPLDWENLAEEIDSLGRATRRELRSRVATIIEHLLKLECSTAAAPRRRWRDTIARERNSTEDLLEENPGLRNQVADMVVREYFRADRLVIDGLRDYGEAAPEASARVRATRYNADQVLGNWFPGDPPDPIPLPANGGERNG
jgi:Domain of unknown function DUF29